jgi:hypothetical protein
MNLSDLQQLTLSWLDDPNATYFTLPQVNRWLNNAQKEVQKHLVQAGQMFYLKPVQTNTIYGQADYVLPIGFLKLHRLEIVISGAPPFESTVPLSYVTLNQQDLVPPQIGQPQFYHIKRNRLTLFPAPDSILPLRLYYSYQVTDLVNQTDVPDCPDHYQEFIAVLATIDGLLKDQRDPTPMLGKRAYYENLLKQDAQERHQDAPRSIVQTGEGAGFSFGYF